MGSHRRLKTSSTSLYAYGGLFTVAGNWALTRGFAVSDTPMNNPNSREIICVATSVR